MNSEGAKGGRNRGRPDWAFGFAQGINAARAVRSGGITGNYPDTGCLKNASETTQPSEIGEMSLLGLSAATIHNGLPKDR